MQRNPKTCGTCGKYTGKGTRVCRQCATNWNDRDRRAGLRQINGRREEAGMAPLERGGRLGR